MNKTFCVYMHECPNGKRYVGITSQTPERRWKNGAGYNGQFFERAIKKYGWGSITHSVLAYGLSKEEAEKAEIDFIQLFKTNNKRFGYNCTIGGDGAVGHKVTDKLKQQYSIAAKKQWQNPEYRERMLSVLKDTATKNRGREMSQSTRDKIAEQFGIEVLQYDSNANLVCKHSSLSEAARAMGKKTNTLISRVCKQKNFKAYGYYWRYANEPITSEEKKMILAPKPHPNGKAVRQFSLDGELLAEYESLHEVERETGFSFKIVWKCASGNKRSAYGYKWSYR